MCISSSRFSLSKMVCAALNFYLLFGGINFAQTSNINNPLRQNFPEVKIEKAVTAPGYCSSTGGSTTFEKITNVSVVEQSGGRLDITVNVFISNPSGCVSGEPCGIYDSSPEYVNVWIDWDGDMTWEPHEQVIDDALTGYQAIGYDGTMTTKKSVVIPPNAKRPTWLRANLGWGTDPQDPCRTTWGFGNVVDQEVLWNMRVQEVKAEQNIMIPGISSTLFSANYDPFGNLISQTGDGIVAAGMEKGSFLLPVTLISFPSSVGENSKTICEWEVMNTSLRDRATINGKSGKVRISVPRKIGFYDLRLNFKFRNELNNRIGEQILTLRLWVSYDTPKIDIKKRIWLEKAIDWANGSISDKQIARNIMISIHDRSGWRYIDGGNPWFELIEGIEDWGNCRNMATVWTNLLHILGVGGAGPAGHDGSDDKGFLSKKGFVSFGNLESSNGNAKPVGFSQNYDRWIFASHWFGKLGSTYYDPVFKVTGSDLYYHVDYDITAVQSGFIYAEGVLIYDQGSSFEFDEGNWPKHYYANANALTKTAYASDVNSGFTGSFFERTFDSDNDGIFDQIGAAIGTEITTEGNYTIIGSLSKDDVFITARSKDTDPSNWSETIGPDAGTYEINPLFSGESIFNSALNGPYKIKVVMLDTSGTVVAVDSFNTSNFSFTEFGEYPSRIISIAESGSDTDDDGVFDEFVITTEFQSSLTDSFTVSLSLMQTDQNVISKSYKVELESGTSSMDFHLPADGLGSSGYNGNYTLSVQLIDLNGETVATEEITTANYSASQFSSADISISGPFSDHGIDINENGLFDSLKVSFNVESMKEGDFTIMMWISNSDYEGISWASKLVFLNLGTNSVDLTFPGEDFNRSGFNGPYSISYAVIQDTADKIYSSSDLYITNSYDYNQFEEVLPSIITSTDEYSTTTIDDDNNGMIDTLVIGVNVIPRDSGNVVALGRLVDSNNETILWTSTIKFLDEKVPQYIELKFDGRYIFGSQVNGPYALKDLQIYHVGDPAQSIDISDPYSTDQYEYTDFEPSGVIIGTVKDITSESVPNVFLLIENVDNDFTNTSGDYNLVILEQGSYKLKIEGPDSNSIEWSIYANDQFAGEGDSLQVDINVGEIIKVDFIAPIDIVDVEDEFSFSEVPKSFSLLQNFPNPFNPSTVISYKIPDNSEALNSAEVHVNLIIYDILGKEVKALVDQSQKPGTYEVTWDPSDDGIQLPSGIYFYKLSVGDFIATRKMILLK